MLGSVRSPRAAVPLLALLLLVLCSAIAGAQDCPPGYSSPTGQAPCTACVPGTQAPSTGSLVCEACPAGTFTATTGTSLCATCPVGRIQPNPGSTTCVNCPSGTTSDATHTACIAIAPGAGPWAQGALALMILGTALVFVRRRKTA